MLSVIGDKKPAMPFGKSPEDCILLHVFDACASFRVRDGANGAVQTHRRDFTGRWKRSVASGDGDRRGHSETGEHERTHRPNETKLSHRWWRRAAQTH